VPIPGEWIRHDVSMDSEQRVDFLDRGSGSSAFMYLRPSETGLSIGFGVEKDGDLDLAVSWEDAERLGKALLQAVVNRS